MKDKLATVFVRNLVFSCTDAELEAAFEDVGPIKSCFTVRRRGTGGSENGCSGIGFVKFAVAEDAARAVTEKDGKVKLSGRVLRCEVARPRDALAARTEKRKRKEAEAEYEASFGARGAGGAVATTATKTPHPSTDGDHDTDAKEEEEKAAMNSPTDASRRTVVVGGYSTSSSQTVMKLVKRLGKERRTSSVSSSVERVTMPAIIETLPLAELRSHGCKGSMCTILFVSEQEASLAVTKLHRRCIDDVPGKPLLWARALAGEGATPRRWRVIVRNIPFSANEDDLMQLMSEAGFVWEISLPRVPKDSSNGKIHGAGSKSTTRTDNASKRKFTASSAVERTRGFAFASYTTKSDAEAAVTKLNGRVIAGRTIAVDWAVAKDRYDASVQQASQPLQQPREEEGAAVTMAADGDERSDADDAAGVDADEDARDAFDEVNEGEHDVMKKALNAILERGTAEVRQTATAAKTETLKRPTKSMENAKSAGTERGLPQERAAREKAVHEYPPPEMTTLFVRGVPPNADHHELRRVLSAYCKILSCRFVKSKLTGKHKGTAFVDVVSKAAADKCVAAAQEYENGADDASGGIFLNSSRLSVSLAVDPDVAKRMMSAGNGHGDASTSMSAAARNAAKTNGKGPKDKRNLYLIEEGRILKDSAAAAGMSKHDEIARERSWKERQTQLRSPDFYVSSTRIVIRNLPLKMGNDGLKRLCDRAVRARATKAEPEIVGAHMIFDKARRNPDGTPRSRGIGFVEFSKHEHAITALRHLNNNPEIYGAERRPIVEFSVENIKLKKRMEARRKRQHSDTFQARGRAQTEASSGGSDGDANGIGHPDDDHDDDGPGDGDGGDATHASRRNTKRRRRAKSREQ